MSEASKAERHRERLGKMLANNSHTGKASVGVVVESARGGKFTRFKNRTAIVSVGVTSFHDPMRALVRSIKAAIDTEESIQPVRHVENATVTPLSDIKGRSYFAPFRQVVKRVPHGAIRMWKGPWSGGRRVGWFFMYPDKVIHVDCTKESGWLHRVVPEDGLSLV